MMSTLSESPKKWHGNGQYVRATICTSGYENVAICVLAGSIGAMAWIGKSCSRPAKYYVIHSVDQDGEDLRPLHKIWLSAEELRAAFGIDSGLTSKSSRRLKFQRTGRKLSFLNHYDDKATSDLIFSVYVSDEMRKIIRHFLDITD